MSTSTPPIPGTASTLVVEPGNGTRYRIVYGDDFVALPEFGVAAHMTPHPVEYTYMRDKLRLTDADAREVFKALNPAPVDDWPTSNGEDCHIVPDGLDTNGDEWSRCTTHGHLVIGDAPYCEGYEAPPYTGGH